MKREIQFASLAIGVVMTFNALGKYAVFVYRTGQVRRFFRKKQNISSSFKE